MSTSPQPITNSVCEQELIDAIGVEATLKLEHSFGSSFLYIGAKAPSKVIIDAIGLEDGMKLVEFFGCGDIWVPRCMAIQRRNEKIIKGINTGKTILELGAEFRMKTPNIRRVLRENKNARSHHK
jgi:hypothetical protein